MSFQIGDKVWVKPLGAIAAIAEKRKRPGDEERLLFSDCGYDFVSQMRKYCERQVEITDQFGGANCYLIKEDGGEWVWHESWLSKELQSIYVSDFEGTIGEKATPAEIYWEQIMPQLKEIVINAYNKGVENGKNECV